MKQRSEDFRLLDAVSQSIFDKKGFNIIALDVRGISTMTDYYIIAEGNVERHVRALSNAVTDAMHQKGRKPLFIEGLKENDWIVIDFGDFIVHLFIPELREKYALENLWKEAKIVDLQIVIDAEGTVSSQTISDKRNKE